MKKLFTKETYALEWDKNILIGIINREVVDLEYAQKIVASRQKFVGGVEFPLLVKFQSIKKVTKEARDFFASKQGCEGVLAGAICVDSVLTNTVANLFLLLSPPSVPTKVFKNEEKAMEWLSKFVVNKN